MRVREFYDLISVVAILCVDMFLSELIIFRPESK